MYAIKLGLSCEKMMFMLIQSLTACRLFTLHAEVGMQGFTNGGSPRRRR